MKINKILLSGIVAICVTTFIGQEKLQKVAVSHQYKNVAVNKAESNFDSTLILVNKSNPLASNYKPQKMKKTNVPFIASATDEEKYMEELASKAIEELFEAAEDEDIKLIATSAYRSYETQKDIYRQNIISRGKEEAKQYVAQPGKSEHQTGLAIDVTNEGRWFHKTTKEAQWLVKNAHRFGFILRYPEGKEVITGYNFEPWHVRYVGKDVAVEIAEKGITLEEYVENY